MVPSLRCLRKKGTPSLQNLRSNSIRKEVEDSLKRLQTDYIDVLQCHWPDPSTPVEEDDALPSNIDTRGKLVVLVF